MMQLTIDLPEALEADLRERAIRMGFVDTQEYVRALIDADVSGPEELRADDDHRLEALLLEGLDSGDSRPMTAEDWDEQRRRLQARQGMPGVR